MGSQRWGTTGKVRGKKEAKGCEEEKMEKEEGGRIRGKEDRQTSGDKSLLFQT